MFSSTSLALDKLSEALIQQHHNLCGETSADRSALKENSQEYEISELAVRVTVTMERIQNEIPKGVAFCGGKLSKDTANITIIPDNEKVTEVISEHFKSQVIPKMMMAPQMSVFNAVTINDKKII